MAPLALQPVALAVFLVLFVFVTVLGFMGARWRRGDRDTLHEWGLGGQRFGTLISWFLLGGDLYTAYTFVAVPALVFGAGAIGFFAVPYTIIIYPILFTVFPRLWRICKRHGYLTAPEFVRGRFDSPALSLAVAVTGILATMPYIALQLVGMQVVIAALGIEGSGIWADAPLFVAFLVLAAFTYTSGLRAPAIIAVVKDLLIYATVIAAAIVIPMHLGGWGKIFAAVPAAKLTLPVPGAAYPRKLRRLCNARSRLGAGALSLSSFHDGHPRRQRQPGAQAERRAASDLLADARRAGSHGVHGACRGRIEDAAVRSRFRPVQG